MLCADYDDTEGKEENLAGYVASEIMLQTILVLGLTPSDYSDSLQHNFLATVL